MIKGFLTNRMAGSQKHGTKAWRIGLLCWLMTLATAALAQEAKDYVDPRIGSEGLGRVFIGPCMPFGMAKPGPDCGVGNNAGWAPMPAAVSGFSQTHVSGTGGGPKYGNILIRPFHGPDQHRATEHIELGKYTCTLQESGIKAEVTAGRKASFYRFSYPEGTLPHVEVDLQHFLGRNPVPKAREAQQFEEARLDSTRLPDGLFSYHGHQTISGGWNNGAPYTVYFHAMPRLCQADATTQATTDVTTATDGGHGYVMLLKVGISFVSEEQARLNAESDLPDWDFDAAHRRCLSEWQGLLSRLPINDEATTPVKRMYYTALYHTCLMPTDRREGTHHAPYDDYYAIWDTYRTSTPLLSLLCPERAEEIAQSLLTIYRQDGFLPDARSGNSNGRTQGGSNAEIVLCDALARGLDIDADLALEAMLKDATTPPLDDEAEGRGGLEEYNRLGYIPYIIETIEAIGAIEPIASIHPSARIPRAGNRTVEYAFCDWAIAQSARMMRERHLSHRWSDAQLQAIEAQYMQQSQRWKNLWRKDYEHDGAHGFIMPRDEQGRWLDRLPFGHSKVRPLSFPYTPDVSYEGPWYCKWWDCFMYEASSWEYSFSIPHDIPGLIELCGGKEAFEARLDTFFAHGYYNVANEPSFLTPLLYHWVGKPEKSTALIRRIIEENFNDQPNGLPGNDDGGAMSSWLACHLLGMYPLAGTSEWIKYDPLWQELHVKDEVNMPDPEPTKPNTFLAKFSLHGQTRRFYLDTRYDLKTKQAVVDWRIQRNLRWWKGSYTMRSSSLKNGRRLCYEQPLDGQHILVPDDQTFLFLSDLALADLHRADGVLQGTMQYDDVRWTLIDEDSLPSWSDRAHTLHFRSDEGAEMWVAVGLFCPLITKMIDNPHEIDWEITYVK